MAAIRKLKSGKFNVQVRRQGHEARSKSFLTRQDAEKWAREIERQMDREELGPDRKALKSITLSDLVERYRDEVLPKKRSCRTETVELNRFLRYPIAKKSLFDLQPRDFAQYRDQRLNEVSKVTGRPILARSLKRQLAPLYHLFEVARREWHIEVGNPLEGLYLRVQDDKRQRRLRPGEEDRLLLEARKLTLRDGTPNPFVGPIIEFALQTAMRQAEILAIQYKHIDFERQTLLIPVAKTGSRMIPLTARAVQILREVLTIPFCVETIKAGRSGGAQYLRSFIGPRMITPTTQVFPVDVEALKASWTRICKRATPQIEDLHFHDLRHEGISRLFELGLSIPEVASISGHRAPAMLFRYAHANLNNVQEKLRGMVRLGEITSIEHAPRTQEMLTV
ncbi:site-specific integrase [Mesorhizobium sp. VK4C]|uniref:tyrosine-type recombinase/integrase n=1 Tax=Mesorhizobium captivum TaxID=3072319 RepID=UPI002A241F88|nr:site-specific integrase [Mesorhizobium sp. VK4C]MDX8500152.1 site-specific integrase [Mesorhizobium sp. VK4C]